MNEKQKQSIKLNLFIEKVQNISNAMNDLLDLLYINDDTLNTMYNDKVNDLPFSDDFEEVSISWLNYLNDLKALKENDTTLSKHEKLRFLIEWLDNNDWEYEITNDLNLYFYYDNDEIMINMNTCEVVFTIHRKIKMSIDELIIDLLNR